MFNTIRKFIRTARLILIGPRSVSSIEAAQRRDVEDLRVNAKFNNEVAKALRQRAHLHQTESDLAARRAARWEEFLA